MKRSTNSFSAGYRWLLRASQLVVALALVGALCAVWQIHLTSDRINHATLLGAAAAHNETAAMKTMLEAGYDPNAEGRKGNSPLLWASRSGNTGPLKLLISYGADVRGTEGDKGLRAAAEYGHIEIVQALLKHGADATGKSGTFTSETPLTAAQKNTDSVSRAKIIALLKAHGAK